MAPVISTGDMPPISSQIYFQVQPFSRLMPSSFSVSSARVMDDPLFALFLPENREDAVPKTSVMPRHAQRPRPEVAGPMAGSGVTPESITPALGLWIPGSSLR